MVNNITFSDTLARSRVSLMSGILLILAIAMWLVPESARSELRIDITEGRSDPMPIAIADFTATEGASAQLGRNVSSVVAADLERSGLFEPIDQKAFIQHAVPLAVMPQFANWRLSGARALVHGAVAILEDERLRVEFRLWDTYAEQQMVGNAYFTDKDNWRRVAHIISDLIYHRITGETGYFDTRIVYIEESGPPDHRIKRLAIMDQDGANRSFLTDGKDLVLTPQFSPLTHEITYLAYYNDQPRVYVFNIETGQQEVLGDFPGMTFAPRFSPDGTSVIMSHVRGSMTNIFTMDLATRKIVQLTDTSAIDTSPSYSPDGRKIVFSSDREGSQQLYVMEADGTNVSRISLGKAGYGTPLWSPRGDLIAFTKIDSGIFYIGVMGIDGYGERLLAKGFLVEGPTWAPNGRVLMFCRQEPSDKYGQGGSFRLYSIDLTGANERLIDTLGDASDPAWSPLLP